VRRWAARVPRGARVLDVAAGTGRHARLFAERGCAVTAVDRDGEALSQLRDTPVRCVIADLENAPWPLAGERFDAVIVTNYLWRALLPAIAASVAPRGVLIYETFAAGNARYGRPSNPDFLLQPGELLQLARDAQLHVLAYEDGHVARPGPARVQRLCALRAGADATLDAEAYPLESAD
jgi:SAM-dependent methyltransferase